MIISSETLLPFAVALVLYVGFHLWYGGRATAMSRSEVDERIAAITVAAGKRQDGDQSESKVLTELRRLSESDDGKEFFMVNLIRFRETALYPPGSGYSGGALEADFRYNKALMPYLFKHGGVPVFVGKVQGRFIDTAGDSEWHRVAVVRYRSRRDMLKMAIDIAPLDVVIHKWAAIEKTQVFPMRTILSLYTVRSLFAVVLFSVAFAAHLVTSHLVA